MKKHLTTITLFAGAALLIIFAVGSKMHGFWKPSGSFLAAVGLQNVISSQGAASSTGDNSPTATSAPMPADTLQQFQNQIQSFNSQLADLRSEVEIANLRGIFTRTLKRGDEGDDVSKLQELLIRFPELYPSDTDTSDTVTGFYGSLTKAAVMQLQSQAGLQETGVFDSATRKKFYESLSALAQGSTSTELASIDTTSTNLKNSDSSQNQTSASAEPNTKDSENQVSQPAPDSTSTQASITDLQNQVSQLSSDLETMKTEITNLQSQLAALQATPTPTATAAAPAPAPTPALAPTLAISNVQVTNVTKISSTITWTTNNSSTSEVDYSTNTNLSTGTVIVNSPTAVTSHSVGLQNLNSGIQYYYRVLSKDSTNALASSAIQSFTTLH